MFGKRLHELLPIREAVVTYAARACEKFRAQHSLCKKVRVCIRAGIFNSDEPKFAKGIICELPYPTDDSRLITKAAAEGQELIYRAGFAFSKAPILLLDLCQRGESTDDLFVATPPVTAERVMGVMDAINSRWRRGAMRSAGVPAKPDWGCGGR